MLKNCWERIRPTRLCVEKTLNFDEIQQLRTCKQKWAKILIGPFSPNLKPLEKGTCPTCLKIAGEACIAGDLQYMLKNCVGGTRPIWLCVEKT